MRDAVGSRSCEFCQILSRQRRENSLAQASSLGIDFLQESGLKGRDCQPDMPQSLSRLLIHLVFSTKNRVPILSKDVRPELVGYFVGTLRNLECPALQIGGMEDHVHLFFGLARTCSIAHVVETVKTSSSKWLKSKGAEFSTFHWQAGYGAFSVSQSDAEGVATYICNQAKHHQRMTFQEEYRRFLERYEVSYDERYVWD